MLRFGLLTLLCTFAARCEHYRFRHFGPDEGLNPNVTRIVQDRIGFLWIGTGNGLFRYDGQQFRRFGIEEGLPGSSVRAIEEAPDGALWILTAHGLARYRNRTLETVEASLPGQELRALAIGANGGIYLGSDHGMAYASAAAGDTRPDFVPMTGIPAQSIGGILAETDGKVWFGCGERLCLLEQRRLRVFEESAGLPDDRWASLLRDRTGTLWVRGARHLYVLPPNAARFTPREEGLAEASDFGTTLVEERDGRVLAATARGLARWDGAGWQTVGAAQGLASDAVVTAWPDREGSIWIGMWGSGMARWASPGLWTYWTPADGLPHSLVTAVRRDSKGQVWAGTGRGLVRFDADFEPRIWDRRNHLAGDQVQTLALGPDGAVWVGCNPGGISRVDPKTSSVRSWGRTAGLTEDRVLAIHIDLEERLWVGTPEGLFRSTGLGTNLRFEQVLPPGMPEHTVYSSFAGDRNGGIWIATSQGLLRWNQDEWKRFTAVDGLRPAPLLTVIEHSDGSIWVGYRDALGVSRLTLTADGAQVEHVTRQSGLPSDQALFLGLDSARRLWIGTDNGVATGSLGSWHTWTRDGGLTGDCALNAFFSEPDGTIWIGTRQGLSRFMPPAHALPPAPAPAVITSVRFGERPRDPGGFAIVPSAANDFRVSFAGLTFFRNNVRFRYRLSGVDRNWVEGSVPETRYANLAAGDYRFEVAARSGSGPWTAEPATVAFRILPRWWEAWWFRAAVSGLFCLVFYGLMRLRLRALYRENRKLARALRDRTPEPSARSAAAEPAVAKASAAAGPAASAGALRVLLAEDNPVNQKLAQKAIEKMGHQIVVVSNGAEAVRAHAERPFDLVLMDLQMPEMDGFAATSAIRRTEGAASAHIPIVAITAHAMDGDRERCLAAGMDDYISKPINLVELARLIDAVAATPVAAERTQ
jgi:ligand-binding sensor domain-containing protein/ActR/RegA family two-component response regulator